MSARVGAVCDGVKWCAEETFDTLCPGMAADAHRHMRRRLALAIVEQMPQGRWCVVRTRIVSVPFAWQRRDLTERTPFYRHLHTIRGTIEFGHVTEGRCHIPYLDNVYLAPPPSRPWWRRILGLGLV